MGLIIATLAIAAMITLRIVAFEGALKERLKASRSDGACDETPCFGGCGSNKLESASSKRSTPHAS